MKIWIHYSDGQYSFSRYRDEAQAAECKVPLDQLIDVSDAQVALWDAIFESERLVQRQLATLDNDWHEKKRGEL